jgi:hypothetical protein
MTASVHVNRCVCTICDSSPKTIYDRYRSMDVLNCNVDYSYPSIAAPVHVRAGECGESSLPRPEAWT